MLLLSSLLKRHFKTVQLLSFLVLLLTSCTEEETQVRDGSHLAVTDINSYQPRLQSFTETKNVLQPSLLEIEALQEQLEAQNVTYGFLAGWHQQYGTLNWDYTAKHPSTNSTNYQLAVPLVDNNQVTAVLIAQGNGSDLTFSLFEREKIKQFVQAYPEVPAEYQQWLVAAAKLVQFDLHLHGINERTLT